MATRIATAYHPTFTLRRSTGLLARLNAHLALFRARRQLASLPDHMLNDIGLSRKEAEAEARRSIWDSPSHWSV